mgnify:CR=1 FL=1
MKKFDGMMPPTFVFADEGKNGDDGPPPSCAIDIGGTVGLTMRLRGSGWRSAHSAAPSGSTTRTMAANCSAAEYQRAPALALLPFGFDQRQALRDLAPR